MKKVVVSAYSALMLLTLVGLAVFSFFKTYNALFCEGSLLVSLLFMLAIIGSKIDNVFKVSLIIGGTAVALVTYLLAMLMPTYLTNNISLFFLIGLLLVEVIVFSTARYFSKFA